MPQMSLRWRGKPGVHGRGVGGESEERSEGSAGRAGNRDRRTVRSLRGRIGHASLTSAAHGAERQPGRETAGSLLCRPALQGPDRLRTQP